MAHVDDSNIRCNELLNDLNTSMLCLAAFLESSNLMMGWLASLGMCVMMLWTSFMSGDMLGFMWGCADCT